MHDLARRWKVGPSPLSLVSAWWSVDTVMAEALVKIIIFGRPDPGPRAFSTSRRKIWGPYPKLRLAQNPMFSADCFRVELRRTSFSLEVARNNSRGFSL